MMTQILQLILAGITTGSIYALIGLGFVLIYNVTHIINLAQGEFVMLGALIMVYWVGVQVPFFLAFFLSILSVVGIGALLQKLVIHPARRASRQTLIIITIGIGISLRGGALLLWGTDPYTLSPFSSGGPLLLGGAVLNRQSLWIFGLTILTLGLLYSFFEYTLFGKALRACAMIPSAARLMGISPDRMSLFVFAVSAGLSALAGIVIAPLVFPTYDMGLMLGLKGFVAAGMGGLTRVTGAVVGGFLLGILESLGAGFISSGFKDAIAFFILGGILLLQSGILLKNQPR
jgi:branched-chain amino acid transport system permease protein